MSFLLFQFSPFSGLNGSDGVLGGFVESSDLGPVWPILLSP